jgi:hypothetical protein
MLHMKCQQGPPHICGWAHKEAAQQTMTTLQAHPLEPQWDTGYGGGYSGYHKGGSYYPSQGTLSLASELEPPPLRGTLTGMLLCSGISVMGLARLSVRWKGLDDSCHGWMTLHTCKQRCKTPSTHRLAWCTTSSVTLGLILMLKSCNDLCLGEVPAAQVWVLTCLVSVPTFLVISSLALHVGRITTVVMTASKYCFHYLGFYRVNKKNSHMTWLGYTTSFASY